MDSDLLAVFHQLSYSRTRARVFAFVIAISSEKGKDENFLRRINPLKEMPNQNAPFLDE